MSLRIHGSGTLRRIGEYFILGEELITAGSEALILGDHIFYGSSMTNGLQASKDPSGGAVFAYRLSDPERFEVVEIEKDMKTPWV